jgi:hypothetical protein
MFFGCLIADIKTVSGEAVAERCYACAFSNFE